MARIIKFRYFHKTTKNMFWHDLRIGNKQMLGGGWVTAFPMDVTDPDLKRDGLLLDPLDIEIMQFTGELAKEDKEIWEGDIIKSPEFLLAGHRDTGIPDSPEDIMEDAIGVVCFQDGAFGLDDEDTGCGFIPLHAFGNDIYVLGNIYEHPELLEKLKVS